MKRRAMNTNYLHAEPEEKLEREKDVTGLGPATRKGLMDTDQKSTLCMFQRAKGFQWVCTHLLEVIYANFLMQNSYSLPCC